MPDLLYEIGTEEIPAGYIPPALRQLEEMASKALGELGLQHGEIQTEGTPRRIALHLADLPVAQRPRTVTVKGPPTHIAFKEGEPTRAAKGFAKKVGIPVEDLERRETDEGSYCFATVTEEGRPVADLLTGLLPAWTEQLHFPKTMRWESTGFEFPRPIRSLCAIFGSKILDIELAGVKADRTTRGHPFLAPDPVELKTSDWTEYRRLLRHARVFVEVKPRRAEITRQIEEILTEHDAAIRHDDLVDEVTYLVEHPYAVTGSFDTRFLDLPKEVLEAAMTEHQRYFPIERPDGSLAPHFIVITNRDEAQADTVRHGNERVLRARLEDAAFFFDADRKRTLDDFLSRLEDVTYHQKVGTYAEKCDRLEGWVRAVAPLLELDDAADDAARAARLAKFDLVTDMVTEFPKLQGIMGAEYARRSDEPEAAATAIREHYLPRHSGDDLPETGAGILVALAEKLDNLTTMFAIGETPTGGTDPFALRRQAQGVIRILQEKGIECHLEDLIEPAIDRLPDAIDRPDDLRDQLLTFFRERMANALIRKGRRHDFVRAVLGAGPLNPHTIVARLEALEALAEEEGWEALVEVGVRTRRMARERDNDVSVDPDLLREEEEKTLWSCITESEDRIRELETKGNYLEAAQLYRETFAEPVHIFFEEVFVNVDDDALRENRLALIQTVSSLFNDHLADLSEIVIEG